jgi:hypothetical protein
MKHISLRFLPLALIFLAISLSCVFLTSDATPTSLPPQTSAPPMVPTQPAPAQPALAGAAPWMIIRAGDGLWAANSDGTGAVRLLAGDQWQCDFSRAIQPNGNLVVVVTNQGDIYHHLSLNLLSFPDGTLQKITDLTTPQTEPTINASPGEPSLEAMRAVSEQNSYAWSPDGTKLAFIANLDGPSADVYLYNVNSRLITRVSSDSSTNYWPSWSPDGNHLLFLGVETFGTGAGLMMSGAWSADGDGSNVQSLFTPASSGEDILGWRDNGSVVLESWSPVNGPNNVRVYNILTKETTSLPAEVVLAVVAEPATISFSADPGAVMFNQSLGLSILLSNQTVPIKLSSKQAREIRWIRDSSLFEVVFEDGSLATYQSDGNQPESAPAELTGARLGTSDVSMYGLIWGWTLNDEASGVWITGPGLNFPRIFNGPAVAPLWAPHNDLTFFSGGILYRTTFDAYYSDLTAVANLPAEVTEAAWVGISGFDIYGFVP